jgi:carbohydrate-selective porin OprB
LNPPEDDIGFAFGTTHVNSRIAWSEGLQNLAGLGPMAVQSNEYSIEFYYTYRPLPGRQVRPNIRDRPRRHQRECKRIGGRADGCEFLTPHRADHIGR